MLMRHNQQVANLPFIQQKAFRRKRDSQESLYKSDQESSHLSIDEQKHKTLNNWNGKHSFAKNDFKQFNSIKNYLGRNTLNNSNMRLKQNKFKDKLYNPEEFVKNLNAFKIIKDASIHHIINQNSLESSKEKNIRKIYLPSASQRNSTLLSKGINNVKSKVNSIRKPINSKKKTSVTLVNTQVQTDKIIPKVNKTLTSNINKKKQKKSQKLEQSKLLAQPLMAQSIIQKKRPVFINLSEKLLQPNPQMSEQQSLKKPTFKRLNNLQTKIMINQSFNQSTSPSTNMFMQSISKLSVNLSDDVKKIRQNSKLQEKQRYSKVQKVELDEIQKSRTSNKTQQPKTLLKEKISLKESQIKKQEEKQSMSVIAQQTQTAQSRIQMHSFIKQPFTFSPLNIINEKNSRVSLQNSMNMMHPVTNKVKQADCQIQFPQVSLPNFSSLALNSKSNLSPHKKPHQIMQTFSSSSIPFLSEYKPKTLNIESSFQIKKYRNGVYFGELNQNGQKHGSGIIFYYNGRLYEGQFTNNLKNGTGYEEFPDGSKYQGDFLQGIKQGKGLFQWSNGQVYEGEFNNGAKHGSGIWSSGDKQSYIGEWSHGKVEGFGVYINKHGDRYEGQFKNSQKSGTGTQRFHNGETYVGQYRKNRPNGVGQYFWANGSYYKGQFVNHLRHGIGYFKMTTNGKTYIYEGQYRNDRKCGYGQLLLGSEMYLGNFENDFKHGYGQISQQGNIKYKGYWVNDKPLEHQRQYIENERNNQMKKQIGVISQHPQLIAAQLKPRINRLMSTKIQIAPSRAQLSKSKSPEMKSISSAQNSLDASNYKRACGCARRH